MLPELDEAMIKDILRELTGNIGKQDYGVADEKLEQFTTEAFERCTNDQHIKLLLSAKRLAAMLPTQSRKGNIAKVEKGCLMLEKVIDECGVQRVNSIMEQVVRDIGGEKE